MTSRRPSTECAGWAVTLALFALSACSYVRTPRLDRYDLRAGYRFEQLPLSRTPQKRNADELFVVLAFSGGGTRAAALSYGVLAQLRAVKFHWDTAAKAPVACTPPSAPECVAMERSLLDEVDVISSVSGGSFTSAYYALYGDSIFNPRGTFHEDFLYHRVQSDLLKQAVYYPNNWKRLRSRIEIAADYHADHIFGQKTFGDLARGARPYLILNATDASTGGRFEFTQEQFDLLCADLSQVPVARGVAASSAFPVLLNSMTVDSYNARGGCGYRVPIWANLAIGDTTVSPARYRAARQLLAYRDSARTHLHLLDGGLADNLGLRGVIQSLQSTDRPTERLPNGTTALGGWSLLSKINNRQVKTVVVITVDARANQTRPWDRSARGPNSIAIVDASAGIPMGNFTTETLELLRTYVRDAAVDFAGVPRFYAMAVSLDNVREQSEREFLRSVGTNFELSPFEVDCLMSRSTRLLREGRFVSDSSVAYAFTRFVTDDLKGTVGAPDVPQPAACTTAAGKRAIARGSHTVDLAVQFHKTMRDSRDVENDDGFSVGVRVAKPNGLGATLSVARYSLGVPATRSRSDTSLGRLRLHGFTAGAFLSGSVGPLEASAGISAGYALGGFHLSGIARERLAVSGTLGVETEASGTWLVKPHLALWHSMTDKLAATVSASYLVARPTVRFESASALPDRKLKVNALRLSAGLGLRIF